MTMMKNRLKLFPLLMIMPMMMATKAQEPMTKSYYDADLYVNYVGVDKDRPSDKNVCYEIEVKNIGEKHITPFFSVPFTADSTRRTYYLELEQTNQVFQDQAIAPGQSEKFYTYVDSSFNFAQRFDAAFACYSHPISDVDFSGAEIKEDYKQKNQYVLKVDNNRIKDYNLALFIDVNYKGENKSFYMYFNPANRTFNTNEKLDLSELTIKKITAYQEVEKNTGNSCTSTSTVLWVLLGIFLTLILSAILTPLIITSAKRRR